MQSVFKLLEPFSSKVDERFIEFDSSTPNIRLTEHFTLHEFLTKNHRSSYTLLSKRLIVAVCWARFKIGAPIWINSSYRDHVYNLQVGGSKNSYHKKGLALDVSTDQKNMKRLLSALLSIESIGGIGVYRSFVHIDHGPERLFVG